MADKTLNFSNLARGMSPLHNFGATAAPAAADLESGGGAYERGSLWVVPETNIDGQGQAFLAQSDREWASLTSGPALNTKGSKGIAVVEFNATAGLAIGTFDRGPFMPIGAVITRFWYRVMTTFTSAADTATISVGFVTDDAAGLLAAIAISDGTNPFDAGNRVGIQDDALGNFSERLTAARQFRFTVAVQALTAGRLIGFAEYVVAV